MSETEKYTREYARYYAEHIINIFFRDAAEKIKIKIHKDICNKCMEEIATNTAKELLEKRKKEEFIKQFPRWYKQR